LCHHHTDVQTHPHRHPQTTPALFVNASINAPSIALTVPLSVHNDVIKYNTSPSGREWMWNGRGVEDGE
jgi:hypothetical protein